MLDDERTNEQTNAKRARRQEASLPVGNKSQEFSLYFWRRPESAGLSPLSSPLFFIVMHSVDASAYTPA